MPYGGGALPFESASKIAHMEMIQDTALNQLLQSFSSDGSSSRPLGVSKSGTLNLSTPTPIKYIVTVDGELAIVPNPIRRDKTLAFVQVGAMVVAVDDLRRIENDPMMDPRDLRSLLERIDRHPIVLPLSGVRIPNCTIKQTNRIILNSILSPAWTNLYEVLEYLLWRDWLPPSAARPPRSMECYKCGTAFSLPRGRTFSCPHCGHDHFLSDYLGLFSDLAEDWGREQVASMVMAAIETLAIWKVPVKLALTGNLARLCEFLLIKDGPLLFRAQGFKLVDSIRDFVEWIAGQGQQLHLVGIEKTGDLVDFVDCYPDLLPNVGDYFLPSIQFMAEEVRGTPFDSTSYRNRVSYGSRVAIRISNNHTVVLLIPTAQMTDTGPIAPQEQDLIGFSCIATTLAALTSSAHDNALLPIILANKAVSLSVGPSSRILDDYVSSVIGSHP